MVCRIAFQPRTQKVNQYIFSELMGYWSELAGLVGQMFNREKISDGILSWRLKFSMNTLGAGENYRLHVAVSLIRESELTSRVAIKHHALIAQAHCDGIVFEKLFDKGDASISVRFDECTYPSVWEMAEVVVQKLNQTRN